MAAGAKAEACDKYRGSYNLDPQLDALLPWEECLEQAGKWASAYLAGRDAIELARRTSDSRVGVARAAVERVRPRLSYLTIEVPPERRLTALSVDCDGFRLGSSAWGEALPMDPGVHVVAVRAPGYVDFTTSVEVAGDAATRHIEVPMLQKAPELPAAADEPPVPAAPAASPPAAIDQKSPAPNGQLAASRKGWQPMRVAAVVSGGVALLAAGGGVYFIAKSSSTVRDRDGICPTGKGCEPGTNAHLAELTSQARSEQRAGVALLLGAGAAAAAGVTLWLLPARAASTDRALLLPVVLPSGGGAFVQGAF
jgi:hypothetical protein